MLKGVDPMPRPELDRAFRALVGRRLAFETLGRPIHIEPLLRLLGRHSACASSSTTASSPRSGAADAAFGGIAARFYGLD